MTPEAGTFRHQIKECCRWGQHNAFIDHENASQRVPALRLGTITKLVSHMPCALIHMKISTTSLLPWCLCPKEGESTNPQAMESMPKSFFRTSSCNGICNSATQQERTTAFGESIQGVIQLFTRFTHLAVFHRHDKNIQKHCLRVCTVNFYHQIPHTTCLYRPLSWSRITSNITLRALGIWTWLGCKTITFLGKKNQLVIATMGLLWTLSHLVGTMQLQLQHLGPPVQQHLRIHL